jgi:azurin
MKNLLRVTTLFIFSAVAGLSQAACVFDLEVGDNLKFNLTEINVSKKCESVTINLAHSGQLQANVMGHNWVLTKAADLEGVANDGMTAGLGADYVPLNDTRVLAASSVIGGGETTSITFAASNFDSSEQYAFFCSFPGHSYSMRGNFIVSP